MIVSSKKSSDRKKQLSGIFLQNYKGVKICILVAILMVSRHFAENVIPGEVIHNAGQFL